MTSARLDLSNISFSEDPMPLEEALKDVESIKIPDDVMKGDKKIVVTQGKPDKKSKTIGIRQTRGEYL